MLVALLKPHVFSMLSGKQAASLANRRHTPDNMENIGLPTKTKKHVTCCFIWIFTKKSLAKGDFIFYLYNVLALSVNFNHI